MVLMARKLVTVTTIYDTTMTPHMEHTIIMTRPKFVCGNMSP